MILPAIHVLLELANFSVSLPLPLAVIPILTDQVKADRTSCRMWDEVSCSEPYMGESATFLDESDVGTGI